MADFRRKEYRGSLLLVQECGPVDIVVDTDAKTVTPSLAKADSGYSVAGGGGGLVYVVPEQTVTITDSPAVLTGVDVSELADGDSVIIKFTKTDNPQIPTAYGSGQYNSDNEVVSVPVAIGETVAVIVGIEYYENSWVIITMGNEIGRAHV